VADLVATQADLVGLDQVAVVAELLFLLLTEQWLASLAVAVLVVAVAKMAAVAMHPLV
jgi:hypothetical protein